MSDELRQITMDEYKALKKKGKIEQLSKPLSVTSEYGSNTQIMIETIKLKARDYEGANTYLIGDVVQLECLVTPFVLYRIDE